MKIEQADAVSKADKAAELNEQLLGELDGITGDFHEFLAGSTTLIKSPAR